jgi:hypothetical protein
MSPVIIVHVAAGGVALVAGFIALFAAKGATVHRKTGIVFVYAMILMGLLGAAVAAAEATEISVVAGLVCAYLVITGMATVRPPVSNARLLNIGTMIWGLTLGTASLTLGVWSLVFATGRIDGLPAQVAVMFGTVALIGGMSDIRVVRSGPLTGPSRLSRHLWRMCFALWIAAASFFFGQADELPKVLQIPALLAVPPMLTLLAMAYWMWRVRWRRTIRGMVLARG